MSIDKLIEELRYIQEENGTIDISGTLVIETIDSCEVNVMNLEYGTEYRHK